MSITSYPTLITTVSQDIEKVGGKNSVVGQGREDKDGRKFILLIAGTSIGAGAIVGLSSNVVAPISNASLPIIGVNTTGSALTTDDYFWCQTYGQATVLTDQSTTAWDWQIATTNGACTDSANTGYAEYVVGFSLGADDVGTVGNIFIMPSSAKDTDTLPE